MRGQSRCLVTRMTSPDRDAISATGMRLGWLALVTGLLPFATGQISYAISAQGGMIPSAVLLAAYWVLASHWLRTLGARDSAAIRVMITLGVTSAAFYVLYALFVGVPGDLQVLRRRTGAAIHLAFAALAQIVLTREILRLPDDGRRLVPAQFGNVRPRRHDLIIDPVQAETS